MLTFHFFSFRQTQRQITFITHLRRKFSQMLHTLILSFPHWTTRERKSQNQKFQDVLCTMILKYLWEILKSSAWFMSGQNILQERLVEFCTWHEIHSTLKTAIEDVSHVPLGLYCHFLSVNPSVNFTVKFLKIFCTPVYDFILLF